ncbi:lipocalin family protein [Limnohabitans sp. TS-CS-82]|uniref:lipocalin family protein n=1 Tax=Limnohabitans sp. TS-CS-82 TaxID=2094193 RepID=UPI001F44C84A|nr:lipocalin family protein [Limnohabitans sp. TS-CS-82]
MKRTLGRLFSSWRWVVVLGVSCGAMSLAQAQTTERTTTSAPIASSLPAVVSIASLDVPRYMGTWYEIAKFPNKFQRKCARHTRAQYLAQGDGTVQVLNRCLTERGEEINALGLARQIGPNTSPRLKVRFAPAWLSWLPQVWGDYWVIDLDDDYQLAAVSEPSREYLWVLSRTPTVDANTYNALLKRLSAQGFDIGKLERSPQP